MSIRLPKTTVFFIFLIVFVSNAWAAGLSKGNILVQTDNVIYEYSREGIRQVPLLGYDIPVGSNDARDIFYGNNGDVYVFNGVFDPQMSIFDPDGLTWDHLKYDGWSIVNNISYGGIASYKNFVYVTDNETAGDGSPQGIVRFNLNDSTAERFAEDIEPIDINLGLDGFLYALSPTGSPDGRILKAYNPDTMDLVRTLDLTIELGWTEHRAVAVNALGEIYLADWDEDIQKLNPDGTEIVTVNINDYDLDGLYGDLFDIDLFKDGTVVVGDRFGHFYILDSNLTTLNVYNTFTEGSFGDGVFVNAIQTLSFEVLDGCWFLCY